MGNSHQGVRGGPANTKTAGGYTASNIRQASLELGGVPIPLFDVGLGGTKRISPRSVVYTKSYMRQRINELQNQHYDVGALEYLLQR